MAESLPNTLRDLLVKLQFLSMIEKGMKPCMSDLSFVSANSWVGAFKRRICNENRKNLINEIELIVDQSIRALDEYHSSTKFMKILTSSIDSSKIGLENLLSTYQDCPNTISRISVILKNINLAIDKYSQHLKRN